MYFDDFNVGDIFPINCIQIEKEKMMSFAQEYDPQQIHTDEAFGKESKFGQIIAPGIMSFMSVWAEFVKSNIITDHFIAAQSFRIGWLAPVLAGDVLTGQAIIKKLTPRNPYNGIVDINLVIFNQDEKMVMDTTTEAILARRP